MHWILGRASPASSCMSFFDAHFQKPPHDLIIFVTIANLVAGSHYAGLTKKKMKKKEPKRKDARINTRSP